MKGEAMRMINRARGAAMAAMLAAAPLGAGQAATFDFSWTGASGYTMTGSFSFADALLGSTAITEADVTSFTMSVFLNGVSQATWSLSDVVAQGANFNFNFNPTTGVLPTGGNSASSTGQEWNTPTGDVGGCSTAGFSSGSLAQGVCVNGAGILDSRIAASASTLTATSANGPAPVPAPAALGLFALGLAGLGLLRQRRAA
jgi:hypothetical protein